MVKIGMMLFMNCGWFKLCDDRLNEIGIGVYLVLLSVVVCCSFDLNIVMFRLKMCYVFVNGFRNWLGISRLCFG